MVSRDLTQVFSPSTRLDGNMRAEAVHLLALCEVICCPQHFCRLLCLALSLIHQFSFNNCIQCCRSVDVLLCSPF